MKIRLLSYNIRFGGIGREKLLAGVINHCKPDLVILQEATHPDVVERLSRECDMNRKGALAGNSLAFLSRLAIRHHVWHKVRFARRRYLELVPEGTQARIFGVHLSAIHSNLTEIRRSYELRELLRNIARHERGFHVITGDFNTLAPGEELDLRRLPARLRTLAWITGGRVRWTTIRHMVKAGYVDVYRALHKDDPGLTFPTWDPHVRLDYSFASEGAIDRFQRCEVIVDAPSVRDASDHFPLLSEIELP